MHTCAGSTARVYELSIPELTCQARRACSVMRNSRETGQEGGFAGGWIR